MALNNNEMKALAEGLAEKLFDMMNRRPFSGDSSSAGVIPGRGGNANGVTSGGVDSSKYELNRTVKEVNTALKQVEKNLTMVFDKNRLLKFLPSNTISQLNERLKDSIQRASNSYNSAVLSSTEKFLKSTNRSFDEIKKYADQSSDIAKRVNKLNETYAELQQKYNNTNLKGMKLTGKVSDEVKSLLKDMAEYKAKYGIDLKKNLDQIIEVEGEYLKFKEHSVEKVEELNSILSANNKVLTRYVSDFGELKADELQARRKLIDGVVAFGMEVAKAAPGLASSRLQNMQASNEILRAINTGVSNDFLNQYRARNRMMISAMGGPESAMQTEDALRGNALRLGLTGENAYANMQQVNNSLYAMGVATNAEAGRVLQNMGAAYAAINGVSIQDGMSSIEETLTQTSTLAKLRNKSEEESLQILNSEVVARARLTKQMGYHTNYIRTVMQQNYDRRYSSIIDRIQQSIFRNLSVREINRRGLGSITPEEQALFNRGNENPTSLTPDEERRFMEIRARYMRGQNEANIRSSVSMASGDFGGAAAFIPLQTFTQMSGIDVREGVESQIAADSRAQLGRFTPDGAQVVELSQASMTSLEGFLQRASEVTSGISSAPGGGILSGIISGAGDIMGMMLGAAAMRGAGGMAGRAGMTRTAALLTRLGTFGGVGGGTTAAAATGTAAGGMSFGSAILPVAASALAGYGVGSAISSGSNALMNTDNIGLQALGSVINPIGATARGLNTLEGHFALSAVDKASAGMELTESDYEQYADLLSSSEGGLGLLFSSDRHLEEARRTLDGMRQATIARRQGFAEQDFAASRANMTSATPVDENGNPIIVPMTPAEQATVQSALTLEQIQSNTREQVEETIREADRRAQADQRQTTIRQQVEAISNSIAARAGSMSGL